MVLPASDVKFCNFFQTIDLCTLEIHGRMNIAVQSDFHGGMTEDLTQGFGVHAGLYAAGRKGVPQGVKRIVGYFGVL